MIRCPKLQTNCDCSIRMDSKIIEGSKGCWLKFAFISIIMFKDFLINLVVLVNAFFISMIQYIIDKLISLSKDSCQSGG